MARMKILNLIQLGSERVLQFERNDLQNSTVSSLAIGFMVHRIAYSNEDFSSIGAQEIIPHSSQPSQNSSW